MYIVDKTCLYLALGIALSCFGINLHQKGKIEILEYRIETLEMEAVINKLLLKQTQRLVVPNKRALKETIVIPEGGNSYWYRYDNDCGYWEMIPEMIIPK